MRLRSLLAAALLLATGPALFGAAAKADETAVRMAVAGPMSGPNQPFGNQIRRGAQQAVDDINARGGVLGRKIELEVGDDQSNPAKAPEIAASFAANKVRFVVGHFNSGVSLPASLAYKRANILQITPASTNPKLTDRGLWNVFRVIGRDDQQGPLWADYVLNHFADKRVALVDDGTLYGTGLTALAQKRLRAGKVKPVLKASVQPGMDLAKLIAQLKTAKADIVLFGGLYMQAGELLRQTSQSGLKVTMIGGDGLVSPEFSALAGDVAIGTLMTFAPRPQDNPAAKDAIANFKDLSPEEGYTLYAYASVQVFVQAIEKAGSIDTRQVAKAMHSGMLFHTVLGDISFDKKGDRKQIDYVFYEWRKGTDGKIDYFQQP